MKYLEGHTHVGFSATSSHWPSFSQGGSQIATMNTGSRVNTNNCQDSDQTGETQAYLGFRLTHNGSYFYSYYCVQLLLCREAVVKHLSVYKH